MKDALSQQVGDHTYRVSHLKTSKAQQMLVELLKLLGPALAALAGSSSVEAIDPKKLAESKLNPEFLGRAIQELAGRVDNAKVSWIVEQLRDATEVQLEADGGDKWVKLAPIYELHFPGRMREWVGWLQFALRVQFADFFA